jgi:hypothetical protein
LLEQLLVLGCQLLSGRHRGVDGRGGHCQGIGVQLIFVLAVRIVDDLLVRLIGVLFDRRSYLGLTLTLVGLVLVLHLLHELRFEAGHAGGSGVPCHCRETRFGVLGCLALLVREKFIKLTLGQRSLAQIGSS